MAVAVDSAERLREEALRLDLESREHKRREGRERKRAREKRQRVDELLERCRELGIDVVIEAHAPQRIGVSETAEIALETMVDLRHKLEYPPTQPIGGHSDHKSTSSA